MGFGRRYGHFMEQGECPTPNDRRRAATRDAMDSRPRSRAEPLPRNGSRVTDSEWVAHHAT
ncbi:hypothetical protein STSO111631_04980 [Stackebrandtia soli]